MQLLATVTSAFGRLIIGRASIRLTDLAVDLLNAGPRALPVVGVVNFLAGAILAYIGAAELRPFRLSILATNLLIARLATRVPGALVTDQWRGSAPDYRLMVQVTRLDITTAGVASLSAYWQIVPRDPRAADPRR